MQDANFQQWLAANDLDANQWSPELLQCLQRRWRSEQRMPADHRLVIDCRGASWPARTYRLKV